MVQPQVIEGMGLSGEIFLKNGVTYELEYVKDGVATTFYGPTLQTDECCTARSCNAACDCIDSVTELEGHILDGLNIVVEVSGIVAGTSPCEEHDCSHMNGTFVFDNTVCLGSAGQNFGDCDGGWSPMDNGMRVETYFHNNQWYVRVCLRSLYGDVSASESNHFNAFFSIPNKTTFNRYANTNCGEETIECWDCRDFQSGQLTLEKTVHTNIPNQTAWFCAEFDGVGNDTDANLPCQLGSTVVSVELTAA